MALSFVRAARDVEELQEIIREAGKDTKVIAKIEKPQALKEIDEIIAVTDGLMRLPIGNPVVTSLEDPILRACYLFLLVLFLTGITLQLRWIRRNP